MSHGQPHVERAKLAEFLRDPRAIRQFELLFEIAAEVGIGGMDAANTAADSAGSRAQQALDLIATIAAALDVLAMAPMTPPAAGGEINGAAREPLTMDDVSPPMRDPAMIDDLSPPIQFGTLGQQQADRVAITGGVVTAELKNNQTILLETTATLTNAAAGLVATMLNSPRANNPTKWVAVNDNGTTRYVPLW